MGAHVVAGDDDQFHGLPGGTRWLDRRRRTSRPATPTHDRAHGDVPRRRRLRQRGRHRRLPRVLRADRRTRKSPPIPAPTRVARTRPRRRSTPVIGGACPARTTVESRRRCSRAEIPCGQVLRLDEVFADPQVWFLPTSGDSRTSSPFGPDGHSPTADASTTWPRSPAPPTTSASPACSPRRARGARTRGSSPPRCSARRRGCKFLVAFRPNSISPTLAAQKAATYQRHLGRSAAAQHRHRWRRHRAATLRRLARPRRALRPHRRVPRRPAGRVERRRRSTSRAALHGRGRHRATAARAAARALLRWRVRRAAELVAAQHVDVYLTWGEPPAMVAPRLERMRELAAEQGGRCASASACT